METPRDDRTAAELRALRPTPRPEFTEKLDERAAAGFPRRSRWPRVSFSLPKKRVLIPAGGVAVVAIAVVTAVVVSNEPRNGSDPGGPLGLTQEVDSGKPEPATTPPTQYEGTVEEVGPSNSSSSAAAGSEAARRAPDSGGSAGYDSSSRLQDRAVERSAELVLAAAPSDVADDATKVFEAVHAHDGVVMRSSTREGEPGVAGARFELLIPSAKLSDALAALSAIDEVRSRHEATNDITAPTVGVGERLRDSKARIDSLLAQLEGAATESERETVEAELSQERGHRARLRSQLQDLQRRADFSRVLVRIETGGAEESGDDDWNVADAFGDARKILAIGGAVTIVISSVLVPLALIALLVWLSYRGRVRRARRRALDSSDRR